jgi:hypothetical protein
MVEERREEERACMLGARAHRLEVWVHPEVRGLERYLSLSAESSARNSCTAADLTEIPFF